MIGKQQNCPTRLLLQNSTLRRLSTVVLIPGVMLTVLALSVEPVYAYIDPGTGSMIIQAIAAAVLTAGAMAGVFWRSIKNFFMSLGSWRTHHENEKDQPEGGQQTNKTGFGQDDRED